MRYIADSNGYLLEVSFGAIIQCNGKDCTEYTGGVPSGYDDLVDWFIKEGDKLYRWKIYLGQLTLDSSVPVKSEPGQVFAPAGYGLGASSIHSLKSVYNEAQAKAISETGWYCYNGASLATGCAGVGLILAEITTDLYKILHFRDLQGFELVNTLVNNQWTGWEWENPVMVPGVEYRTRERYDVKPVYTQLVDLGTTSTDYSATVNIPGITRLLHAVPVLDNRICTDWDVDAGVNTNNQFYCCPEKVAETVVFYMRCGSYRTGKNLKAQIWYTK